MFFYSIIACKKLPRHIQYTINQAIYTQHDCCEIYLITDCAHKCGRSQCSRLKFDPRLNTIHLPQLQSNKTKLYTSKYHRVFAAGGLWKSSALRFFALEDFMRMKGIDALLQVEADNLLYISMKNETLPLLIRGYQR